MTAKKTESLDDFFSEEEARLVAEAKAEAAAKKAAWEALPQAERDRISAERAERYETMFDHADEDQNEEEDEEDEEEGR